MRYLLLIIKHKWFVLLAGLKVKCPIWRLITHDFTKLLPCELPHYHRQFFGPADQPDKFIKCWLHHQNHNDHHWEYWIPRTGHNKCTMPYPDNEPLPMPENAAREMVADWLGAGRAYQGKWPDVSDWSWYNTARPRMKLHQQTAELIDSIIRDLQNDR